MTRFKAGQRARMQRLVVKALRIVEEKRLYQKLIEAPDFKKRPLQERLRIQRGAVLEPYMLIYRNVSVPQYVDLRIDPSDRSGERLPDHFELPDDGVERAEEVDQLTEVRIDDIARERLACLLEFAENPVLRALKVLRRMDKMVETQAGHTSLLFWLTKPTHRFR